MRNELPIYRPYDPNKRSRPPRPLTMKEYERTQTIFDKAKLDVGRFMTSPQGFLPSGTTNLGAVLGEAKLVNFDQYFDEIVRLQRLNNHSVEGLIANKEKHRSNGPSAVSIPALVAGRKKVMVIADRARDWNPTHMTQALLEELSHAYCLEEILGPLSALPFASVNYAPLVNTSQIGEYLDWQRTQLGIDAPFDPKNIIAQRVGGSHMFEETISEGQYMGLKTSYQMPKPHDALEEVRANMFQTICMAKVMAGNAKVTSIYDSVAIGLKKMGDAGYSSIQRKGYNRQIFGYCSVAPVVAELMGTPRINQLGGLIRDLHDGDFDQLSRSSFATANGSFSFNEALRHFADI